MENVEYIILGLVGLAVILLLVILLRRGRGGDAQKELIELRTLTQRQTEELSGLRQQQEDQKSSLVKELSDQYAKVLKELSDSRQSLTSSLGGQGKELESFFGKVQSQLTTVTQSAQELNRQSQVIGRLSELLQAPKQRGGLGEQELELVLAEILPAEYYRLQYELGPGLGKVDAVIILGDRMVPVDSKFPMSAFDQLREADNADTETKRKARGKFVKAVKERIDEASKYVRPDARTIDFGLVFLPAEGIYLEAATHRYPEDPTDDLIHYANSRKMALVSPSLFFAYLRTIYLGLNSLRVAEHVDEIVKGLAGLRTLLQKVMEPLRLLGKHINNARAQYDNAMQEVNTLDVRMSVLTTGVLSGEAPPELPGPPPGGEGES
jgi:DNA recombination protein RmuC